MRISFFSDDTSASTTAVWVAQALRQAGRTSALVVVPRSSTHASALHSFAHDLGMQLLPPRQAVEFVTGPQGRLAGSILVSLPLREVRNEPVRAATDVCVVTSSSPVGAGLARRMWSDPAGEGAWYFAQEVPTALGRRRILPGRLASVMSHPLTRLRREIPEEAVALAALLEVIAARPELERILPEHVAAILPSLDQRRLRDRMEVYWDLLSFDPVATREVFPRTVARQPLQRQHRSGSFWAAEAMFLPRRST